MAPHDLTVARRTNSAGSDRFWAPIASAGEYQSNENPTLKVSLMVRVFLSKILRITILRCSISGSFTTPADFFCAFDDWMNFVTARYCLQQLFLGTLTFDFHRLFKKLAFSNVGRCLVQFLKFFHYRILSRNSSNFFLITRMWTCIWL